MQKSRQSEEKKMNCLFLRTSGVDVLIALGHVWRRGPTQDEGHTAAESCACVRDACGAVPGCRSRHCVIENSCSHSYGGPKDLPHHDLRGLAKGKCVQK